MIFTTEDDGTRGVLIERSKRATETDSNGLYEWQSQAIDETSGNNAILTAPTGAGKTKVALAWADIDNPNQQVIITAPIKALSNERYAELLEAGYDVGINTGDFKENTEARIICCTQEIYTNKYANRPNQNVVIDEFHYVGQAEDRARAYIEGIKRTNPSSKLLLMSATLSNAKELGEYMQNLTGRDFVVSQNSDRATELYISTRRYDIDEIGNALVFSFSRENADSIAFNIADTRYRYNDDSRKGKAIRHLADKLGIDDEDVIYLAMHGVGTYYGAMLPKEKLFVEELYKNRVIDVVSGTDALALGVNLPAENVIFAQIAKYYSGSITTAEFMQMAGRAGRAGYYDTGFVGLYETDGYESYNVYDQEEEFVELFSSEIEPLSISIRLDFSKLLEAIPVKEDGTFDLGEDYLSDYDRCLNFVIYLSENPVVQDEINFISKANFNINSSETYTSDDAKNYARNIFCFLDDKRNELIENGYAETGDVDEALVEIVQIAKETYFNEFGLSANLELASLYFSYANDKSQKIQTSDLLMFSDYNKDFQKMLQVKRYIEHLPKKYKKAINGKGELESEINRLDSTASSFARIKIESDKELRTIIEEKDETTVADDVNFGNVDNESEEIEDNEER